MYNSNTNNIYFVQEDVHLATVNLH